MNIPTVADVHLATIEGDEQGITPEEVRMALEAIPQSTHPDLIFEFF
jgi:hypothetical protein